MSLTAQLSQLIHRSQPDDAARQRAREGVQDYLAVSWPVLNRQVPDSGLPQLQSLYCDNGPASRALLLGYAGHALDYDDFHADFRGHPSVVILPALLAWSAESDMFCMARFLDAYVVGVEMAGRLGLAMTQRHYTLGYHNTASLGTLAAAAALAHISGADARQTSVLLGIAATEASGLRAQFGSAVKPLHAGFAAERAVRATQLALTGFDGQADGVLESFIALGSAGEAQQEKLSESWGKPWRIVAPGLEFKPFATCAGTHSAAEATREIRQRWTGSPEALVQAIERITVAFPPGGDIAASVRQPHNGIEARFSLEYVIAAMLIYGDLRMSDFAEGEVNPQIMALATKVTRQPDKDAPPDAVNLALRFHEVTLFLNSGEILHERRTRRQSLATPVDVAGKLQAALANCSELLCHSQLADDNDLRDLVHMLVAAL